MGDSCHKAHLHLSVETEVFIRRERETEQRVQERGLKSSLHEDEHKSVLIKRVVVQCALSWFRHPGSTVEGQQISQNCDV